MSYLHSLYDKVRDYEGYESIRDDILHSSSRDNGGNKESEDDLDDCVKFKLKNSGYTIRVKDSM